MVYKATIFVEPDASLEFAKNFGSSARTSEENTAEVNEILDDLISHQFTVIIRHCTTTADAVRALYRWLDNEDCILTNITEIVYSISLEPIAPSDESVVYIDCIAEISSAG